MPRTANAIRLLLLEPGYAEQPLICRTIEHDDEAPRNYEALSYTWGPSDNDRAIELNGQTFPIRHNLWTALHYLRLQDEPRILWVDAVCIDQSDVLERNHQVLKMDRIYQGARVVLVWLGDGFNECRGVVPTLGQLSIEMDSTPDQKLLAGIFGQASILQDLTHLFEQSYWMRTWIVQEVLLAHRIVVLCGTVKISWLLLREISKRSHEMLAECSSEDHDKHRNIEKLSRTPAMKLLSRWHTRKRMDLRELICDYEHTICADPRDKIFAMLGLIKGSPSSKGRNAVLPDYSKTTYEVYGAVMANCIPSMKTKAQKASFNLVLQRTLQILSPIVLDSGLLVERRLNNDKPVHFHFPSLSVNAIFYTHGPGRQDKAQYHIRLDRLQLPREAKDLINSYDTTMVRLSLMPGISPGFTAASFHNQVRTTSARRKMRLLIFKKFTEGRHRYVVGFTPAETTYGSLIDLGTTPFLNHSVHSVQTSRSAAKSNCVSGKGELHLKTIGVAFETSYFPRASRGHNPTEHAAQESVAEGYSAYNPGCKECRMLCAISAQVFDIDTHLIWDRCDQSPSELLKAEENQWRGRMPEVKIYTTHIPSSPSFFSRRALKAAVLALLVFAIFAVAVVTGFLFCPLVDRKTAAVGGPAFCCAIRALRRSLRPFKSCWTETAGAW